MLTRMTGQDWAVALEASRAARSRRGDKGRDDRRVLEALHCFAVRYVTWRALPAEFGRWNSVWKRFWRLGRTGVSEAFFRALVGLSGTAHLAQMFDSTAVRARMSRPRAPRGQDDQALGRSRRGFGTKIHPKYDLDGLPLDFHLTFHLTGGEASDSRRFETLLDVGPDLTPRAVVTDRGCDARANRQAARDRGIRPAIPYRSDATDRPGFVPRALHRGRARIEQTTGKLKRFRRIALRCEKTAENYAALVAFVCGLILAKSAHTARTLHITWPPALAAADSQARRSGRAFFAKTAKMIGAKPARRRR